MQHDWKEGLIGLYLFAKHEKISLEGEMRNNPLYLRLNNEIEKLEEELEEYTSQYKEKLISCDTQIRNAQDELLKNWDIEDKSFKCYEGSATIRTTRSLKIDNKEMLISILQHIGKLTQCIEGWDLTYLRKLADAGLFDAEHNLVTHYDEKRNVIISAAKKGDAIKK
jgi:hypothetical protein